LGSATPYGCEGDTAVWSAALVEVRAMFCSRGVMSHAYTKHRHVRADQNKLSDSLSDRKIEILPLTL